MKDTSVRPTDDMETIVHTYGNMLFRLCLITLGNSSDAEDVVQETFIKYMQKRPVFENTEHEKARLITVATNRCKDMLRFKNRHPIVDVSSKVVIEGEATEMLDVIQEKVYIDIPLNNITSGEYKLVISELIGGSKADQPLVISGAWECGFTK